MQKQEEAKPITREAWRRLMEKGYAVVRCHKGRTRLYVMQVDLVSGETTLQLVTFEP